MAGCTGHCCAKFWLPWSVDRIKKLVAKGAVLNGSPDEIKKIEEMVIPLEDENQNTLKFAYTCRHWDKTTRLCTNYENRPIVCKEHPLSMPCNLDQTGKCTEPMGEGQRR